MTSLLTIWPSAETSVFAAKVEFLMKENGLDDSRYRTLECGEMDVRRLAAQLSAAYGALVPLDTVDPELHCVVVLPLWEDTCIDSLKKIAEAMALSANRMSVLVMGLQENLRHLFDKSLKAESRDLPAEKVAVKANIERIDAMIGKLFPNGALILVDDYIVNGAPVGFTLGSLGNYFVVFFTALCQSYRTVVPPALTGTDAGRLLGVGISSLEFSRRRVAEFLLHRAFTAALDRVAINTATVDTQRALSKAHDLLDDIEHRYPRFYEQKILPLLRQPGAKEYGAIAAEAVPLLDKEVNEIESELNTFLHDDKLSLPEKEAILALVVGRDSSLLRGVTYADSFPLLDDAVAGPVNLYIDTFNRLGHGDSSILPVRGDIPLLKRDEETGDAATDAENKKYNSEAFDPRPQIKELKRTILDSTAFIRKKEDELAVLEKGERERRVVEEDKRKGGERPAEGKAKLPPVVEQPLDEQYDVPAGFKPMESVDLRPYFSPVRNQKDLGACGAFAVTAMYEAIMNRFSPENAERADLSERFLFYYTNVVTGKPDQGSNYREMLHVLGTKGICSESLYPYTTVNLQSPPTLEAIDDAERHRVLKALQIPLSTSGSDEDKLRANHRLYTSALSQGYPVGIALRLYDNFGDNGPYINRPTAEQKAGEVTENHGMVIVGYSEKDKFYIVRNSWSADFGDKGYCYISAAYIDDPELCYYACIITETTETGAVPRKVLPLTAQFGNTEAEINMASIRNILDEARVQLESRKQLYQAYYSYYATLMQRLQLPNVRNDLRRLQEDEAAKEFLEINELRSQYSADFTKNFKAFKQRYLITAAAITAVTVIYGAAAYLLSDFEHPGTGSIASWIIGSVMIVVSVALWLHYPFAKRRRRRDMQELLDDLSIREERAKQQFLETQIQFHIGGLWIDRLQELRTRLNSLYRRLESYNDHLRNWYREDTEKGAVLSAPEGAMFISLADEQKLSEFFDRNCGLIVDRINLMDTFDGYKVEDDSIKEARRRLAEDVGDAIRALMSNFSMTDHLLGVNRYDYVDSCDMAGLLATMLRRGQAVTRHVTTGLTPPVWVIVADVSPVRQNRWSASISPHFPVTPVDVPSDNADTIAMVSLQPLSPGYLR